MFALLDPDPDPLTRLNPDPQHCLELHLVEAAGQLHCLGQWLAGQAGLDQDQIRHA